MKRDWVRALGLSLLVVACGESKKNTSGSDGTGGTAGSTASGGSGGTAGGGTGGGGTGGGSGGSAGSESSGGAAGASGSGACEAVAVSSELGELYYAEDESPFGDSFADWGDAWWKWLASIDDDDNPIWGGDCTQQQAGDVWFLAGSVASGPETRACTVPSDVALLFPVLSSMTVPCPEGESCDGTPHPDELVSSVTATFENGVELSVELDSQQLPCSASIEAYSSEPAVIDAPASNPLDACWLPVPANNCGIPEGDRPFASAGYWTMLKPLAPGEHTLKFYGRDGDFVVDVTYQLTVTE